MFKNKKIFILGMARSGYEAAKLLAQHNNQIILNDMDLNQDENHIKELEKLGIKVVIGSHPDDLLTKDFDYLIKNPGIKDIHKYVKFAKENGIKVINEIEMAYHFLPKDVKIIGITGTNGKTTTTTLIYEMIKKDTPNVHLIGNMGFPLSSFISKIKSGDILVMEISIQQLVNFIDFKTDISVLTNISEAHLDHVGGFENYMKIKGKIFNRHTKKDLAIINKNDNFSSEITKNINSSRVYFSINSVTNCYFDGNFIIYRNKNIIDKNHIKLVGNHNYENIMCAICVCMSINIPLDLIREVLKEFSGVEHRLEFVTAVNDISFYNDSKATNNKSTMIALSAFDKPTIIIMGGLDRGQTFDELAPYINNVKTIVCYGETKSKIEEFAKKHNKECYVLNGLKEATLKAYECAMPGYIVLLSPACASWDQYKCFEDRGIEFKNIVNNLERR